MDELLMLDGVSGVCPDCQDERILVPADSSGTAYCCTSCCCAVWLLDGGPSVTGRRARRSMATGSSTAAEGAEVAEAV